jgi:hypothetical protein
MTKKQTNNKNHGEFFVNSKEKQACPQSEAKDLNERPTTVETPAVDKSLIRSNSPTPREQQAVHHNENLAAFFCVFLQFAKKKVKNKKRQLLLPPRGEP